MVLRLQDATDGRPHCYFGWTGGNPLVWLLRYALFGEEDTPMVVPEGLGEAEKNPKGGPAIHGG